MSHVHHRNGQNRTLPSYTGTPGKLSRPTARSPVVASTYAPEHELTPEQEKEIEEAFNIFDQNRDGSLNPHELKVAMRALGFDVDKSSIRKIMQDNQVEAAPGRIYKEDFYKVMAERILARDPMEEIERAFTLFDLEGKGKISLQDLKQAARSSNEAIDENELRAMIDEFDLDDDGYINLKEFISIMQDE